MPAPQAASPWARARRQQGYGDRYRVRRTRPANRAVGIGEVATAAGTDSTAIGANTSAGFAFSVALGANAQATAVNQMMFGTATNILAAPGLVSAASRAAQTGRILMVTVDTNGNLAAAAVPRCRCRSSGREQAGRTALSPSFSG